jgi:hypothetical protein
VLLARGDYYQARDREIPALIELYQHEEKVPADVKELHLNQQEEHLALTRLLHFEKSELPQK